MEMDGEITPAANHLFDLEDDSAKMDEEKAHFYHTYLAKILVLCKHARPDPTFYLPQSEFLSRGWLQNARRDIAIHKSN